MALSRTAALFISEFLCTSLLVMCTCLACSSLDNALVPLSAAYGLIQLVLVNCFGQISGAYANPAVAFALWWRGCMSFKRLITYTMAETSGAIAGHYLVNKMLGKSASDTLCAFAPKADMKDANVMGTEFFLTFLLIMSWCVLWDYEGDLPLEWYLAGVNALVCLLGGYLTGASTNPARTLAPAVFLTKTDRTHICLLGQYLAAIVAPFLWGRMQYWAKS